MTEAEQKRTKYETARIIGSRALQIAMGAPFLIKLSEEELEELQYSPIRIAQKELEADVLPLTIKRPKPKYRGSDAPEPEEESSEDEE